MKRLALISAGAVLVAAAAFLAAPDARSAPESASWAGDTVHSFVLFKVKHMGTSWTYGRFNDFTVSVDTDAAGSAVTAANFVVKAESIDTGAAKRDQHLRSPDFLNSKEFAEITFKSTKAKPLADGATELTGDLTLHGVTKPVTVTLTKTGAGKGMKGEDLLGYETTFSVPRKDFGIATYPGAIGDDVSITVAVELAKK
jgi:polyisoprenoid-binding protein YceI